MTNRKYKIRKLTKKQQKNYNFYFQKQGVKNIKIN